MRFEHRQTFLEAEVIEHHIHPDISVTTPNGRLRVGALTFDSAADGENVVLGLLGSEITYIFKTALGAPGADEVHVKTQGTTILSARKLVQAIAGVTDAANITYGAGVGAHPDFRAAYTGKRISIGTSVHVDAVPTVLFVGKMVM